jgi:hypothetical protein
MQILVDPDKSPNHFGIGLEEVGETLYLVIISDCCLVPIEWISPRNRCSKCLTVTRSAGYSDSSRKIYKVGDNPAAEKWICTWLSIKDVEIKVEW